VTAVFIDDYCGRNGVAALGDEYCTKRQHTQNTRRKKILDSQNGVHR
jgi:hypothetical protein